LFFLRKEKTCDEIFTDNKMKLNVYNTKKTNHYRTPKDLYDKLDSEHQFNFDPCPLNGVDSDGKSIDGLKCDWGTSTFVNPPYSDIEPWCKKAREEQLKGKQSVLLIPCRSSTHYWHDWILPFAEVTFIRGRLRFGDSEGNKMGIAPFPSVLVLYRGGL
jgi:site-specific DNA-methyltransferase (adenine-specific)